LSTCLDLELALIDIMTIDVYNKLFSFLIIAIWLHRLWSITLMTT
jgi:hypothetical protein